MIPSKLYVESSGPIMVCDKYFKETAWLADDGPIKCSLCDKRYQRWIFHWTMDPVKDGSECYCHVYPKLIKGKEIIRDSYVDPEEYEWIGTKPNNFDPNKPFCGNYLTQ